MSTIRSCPLPSYIAEEARFEVVDKTAPVGSSYVEFLCAHNEHASMSLHRLEFLCAQLLALIMIWIALGGELGSQEWGFPPL